MYLLKYIYCEKKIKNKNVQNKWFTKATKACLVNYTISLELNTH